MNAGTRTARSAPLSYMAANEGQTKNSEFPVDFPHLCGLAMDQALGIQQTSLATLISLNSYAIETYQDALWFMPTSGDLLDTVSQAVAYSMAMQLSWLTLFAPHASSTVSSNSGQQSEPTEDALAYSMDIAIGEQVTAPRSTVTRISGGQTRQKADADMLERSMDIALGPRAA